MKAQRYRTKVVELEAVKVSARNLKRVAEWCNGKVIFERKGIAIGNPKHVRLGFPPVIVWVGDYLAKNESGGFFAFRCSEFEREYEPDTGKKNESKA